MTGDEWIDGVCGIANALYRDPEFRGCRPQLVFRPAQRSKTVAEPLEIKIDGFRLLALRIE